MNTLRALHDVKYNVKDEDIEDEEGDDEDMNDML